MGYSCIIALRSAEDWTEESHQNFHALKKVFDEVLIVSPDHSMKMRLPPNFKRVTSQKVNRAHQFNLGAQEARTSYLSFLHFESDFDPENFARLRLSLRPQTLFYFEFKFSEPKPKMCKLNEWAINARADWSKLPFGNQCYSVDKKSFLEVGGFSERVIQNEDAEFIKRWKQKGFAVKKANGLIRNSPQIYSKDGWLKTTARNFAWSVKYCFGKEPRELIPHS